jgi:hypothetical protein
MQLKIFLLSLLLCSCHSADDVGTTVNSVAEIINDMSLPHEGKPHGVPSSFDWAAGPRLSAGNNPGNFTACIPWGQVYEDANGNPATNSRVQLKTIKAYYLNKKDNAWKPLANAPVQGNAYVEDFSNDSSRPGDSRPEADGGISVKAGGGYNFHFWSERGRVTINATDIGGLFVTMQARLVVDNASQPDDRSKAKYLLSMGADYWIDLKSPWSLGANADAGIGRFRYVNSQWRAFNMSTLTATQLRANPPPIE